MKNLFLVNSSINLLTTFVLANSKFKNDENYLALVHPHGYDRWHEDAILRFMSSKEGGFKEVFPLIDRSFSKHLAYVKKEICPVQYDKFFVGNDCGVQNQLLLSALKVNKFYRIDDGTGSYYNENAKRPWYKVIVHKTQVKLAMLLMGISSDLPINTLAMGESKAAIGDYLLMPELLKRHSPKVFEITDAMIREAIQTLFAAGVMKEELANNEYVIYLSEPITENGGGKFTFEDEIDFLKKELLSLDPNVKLIYKPHPNDKAYKVEYIKNNIPEIIVTESKVPVEFILCKELKIKEVISYISSTLIFAKKITGRDIICTSLAKKSNIPLSPVYMEMLEKSGVKFL